MRLTIEHKTIFQYEGPPSYGLVQLRMTPQTSAAQQILSSNIAIEGGQEQVRFLDQHGNLVQLIEVLPEHSQLTIDVRGEVDTRSEDGVFGHHSDAMPIWFYRRQTRLTTPTPDIRSAGETLMFSAENTIGDLHALSQMIRDRVAYAPGQTDISTTAGDAWLSRRGVCQDHTHIFLSIVREKGLPARYVSGYLLMDDFTDQDASHAWAEVCIDGLGWVGFDVSNGISPDARYVRIAQGSDYLDAAPTTGLTMGAGQETLSVSIQVQQ